MNNSHSKLPPSSAARRVACPGSRALEALYPEKEDSPYAREGEAAHWVASTVLRWDEINLPYTNGERMVQAGTKAPNDEVITIEMIDGAKLYFEAINEKVENLGLQDLRDWPAEKLHVEEKIDISNIHPDCWGTPDCWFVIEDKLYLFDYKFGFGFVEVYMNWQLLEYSAGIIKKLNDEGIKISEVEFCIVQPRSYHPQGPIRTWNCSLSTLTYCFSKLKTAEQQATSERALCYPNPECDFCLARHACPTLQNAALTETDVSMRAIPNDLTTDQIGNELRYLKRAAELLDARITGLEAEAISALQRGERIPHFALKQTMGRDRWLKSASQISVIGEMYNLNLCKPVDVITPKQAIKLGLPKDIVDMYSETPIGSLKLTAISNTDALKVFGDR